MDTDKRTLAKEIAFSGTGVHSGKPVNLRLRPSESGSLIFRRLDLDGLEILSEPWLYSAQNCTIIKKGEVGVRTVEHLLAALRQTGVDSALIELDAEEVPILDGSAAPFVAAVVRAGTVPFPDKRKALRITSPFRLHEGVQSVSFEPDLGFRISYSIDFAHPLIHCQDLSLALTAESFAAEIAPARTFGFARDAEKLRSLGLALGSSFDNTVVLDDEKLLNPPLRFPDEFVRHKILDLAGDLATLGAPVVGHVRAVKAGHALHLRAVQSLLQNPSCWAWTD